MITPQPGWYADPWQPGHLRWWDGAQWTANAQPEPTPARPVSDQRHLEIGATLGILALVIIGGYLANFTEVSLLTGTGEVWLGVVLTVVAAIAAFVLRRLVRLWIKIVAVIVAAVSIASGIYDEVQLQHKRDQLSNFGASAAAVSLPFAATGSSSQGGGCAVSKFVDEGDATGITIRTREGVTYDAADERGHARAVAARQRNARDKANRPGADDGHKVPALDLRPRDGGKPDTSASR